MELGGETRSWSGYIGLPPSLLLAKALPLTSTRNQIQLQTQPSVRVSSPRRVLTQCE